MCCVKYAQLCRAVVSGGLMVGKEVVLFTRQPVDAKGRVQHSNLTTFFSPIFARFTTFQLLIGVWYRPKSIRYSNGWTLKLSNATLTLGKPASPPTDQCRPLRSASSVTRPPECR